MLGILSQHGVRYLIVGSEAVIHYGLARLTGNIDVSYEPTADNTHVLYDALREFWQGAIREIRLPAVNGQSPSAARDCCKLLNLQSIRRRSGDNGNRFSCCVSASDRYLLTSMHTRSPA